MMKSPIAIVAGAVDGSVKAMECVWVGLKLLAFALIVVKYARLPHSLRLTYLQPP